MWRSVFSMGMVLVQEDGSKVLITLIQQFSQFLKELLRMFGRKLRDGESLILRLYLICDTLGK